MLKCDVHYYEDGNVRLTTSKPLASTTISSGPSSTATAVAAEIAKTIAAVEKRYQEELNRGFARLSEGEFKALRRQLPVTRQKVEWEKIGGYRVSLFFFFGGFSFFSFLIFVFFWNFGIQVLNFFFFDFLSYLSSVRWFGSVCFPLVLPSSKMR